MDWSKITVQQFQDIYKLTKNTALDETDKVVRVIGVIFGVTEKQVDEMTQVEFNAKAKECAFLMENTAIPGKPVSRMRIGTKWYKIQYNPAKLRHRQYVEILHYSNSPIENMHLVLASLVQPVKWGIVRKNKAEDHEAIAADMLNASLCEVYHAAVFFCKLFINSMESLRQYLVAEMMKTKKIARTTAEQIVGVSLNAMAGFIQPSNLQNMNV